MSRYRKAVRVAIVAALPGALALAIHSAGHSQPAVAAAETIRLSHITPSQFVSELVGESERPANRALPPFPAGIDQISPNDVKGTVTVRGESADLEKVRQLAHLLDTSPQRLRLNVKVARIQRGAGATQVEFLTPVADGVTEITSGSTGRVYLYGSGRLFVANLTPRRIGDGTILLSASVDMCRRQSPGGESRETMSGEWMLSKKKASSASDLIVKSPDEPDVAYRVDITAE